MRKFSGLSRLRSILAHKRVLIVGSAPNCNIPDLGAFDVVVSVNGSSTRVVEMGLEIAAAFITSELLSDECSRDVWQSVKRVTGDSLTAVPTFSIRNGAHFEKKKHYSRYGLGSNLTYIIRLGQMRRLTQKICGSKVAGQPPDGLPSTGILAAILCFSAGASQVLIAGLSFSIPVEFEESHHYYDEPVEQAGDTKPRMHTMADAHCITGMKIAGNDLVILDRAYQFLLQNWGISGATWFTDNILSRVFWSKFALW